MVAVAPAHPCVWVVRATLVVSIFSSNAFLFSKVPWAAVSDTVLGTTFNVEVPANLDNLPADPIKGINDVAPQTPDEMVLDKSDNKYNGDSGTIPDDEPKRIDPEMTPPVQDNNDVIADTDATADTDASVDTDVSVDTDDSDTMIPTAEPATDEANPDAPLVDDNSDDKKKEASSVDNEIELGAGDSMNASYDTVKAATLSAEGQKPMGQSRRIVDPYSLDTMMQEFIDTNADPLAKWEEVKRTYRTVMQHMENQGDDPNQWFSNANYLHLQLFAIPAISGLAVCAAHYVLWCRIAKPILRFIYQKIVGIFRGASAADTTGNPTPAPEEGEKNPFEGTTPAERAEILKTLEERLAKLEVMEAHINHLLEHGALSS